ncbi:MAG: EAL domain-containing protein [Pseudomonadales bacterium]|nr:EAL domain-containing protein [Pseudomonadales bacterium]
MAESGDDLMVFADEIKSEDTRTSKPWKILVVDDDPDVHAATRLALKGLTVEGRSLDVIDAYSASEALAILKQDGDYSVALIDVVMESDDAGLGLVQEIRNTLDNHSIRLILRTGQPGFAPESETIRLYDINDYKTKSELTRVRLFTSIAIAIRSYSQIKQLEANQDGLERILAAASELGRLSDMDRFAASLIRQLCGLLKEQRSGFVVSCSGAKGAEAFVLSAAGRFHHTKGSLLEDLPDTGARQQVWQVLREKQTLFQAGLGVYFPGTDGQAIAAYVDLARDLSAEEQRLLEVFCSNVAVAFENLQLYRSIEQLAYQDPLIGLPNRNGFVAEIEQRISLSALQPQAVVLVDLDNFSYMNSVLDEAFGDDILRAVVQRMRSQLSHGDFIARVGGDVFGVVGNACDLTPERIAGIFAEPFTLHQNEPLRISATSGLILLKREFRCATEILKNVGVALKHAKHFYRGKTVLFATELADAARDRMHLLSRLRTAFSREHLKLHFQPFVRLRDGAAVGAECLLRWEIEPGQFISPDQFIPLAEQAGMMVALGDWVTSAALRWRAGLQGQVADDFRVAINMSLMQLREADFVENLIGKVQQHGLKGQHVEIELTESIAADDVDGIIQKLTQLRDIGISIAMDDFGTGYSSLSILNRLPIDRLKIDRSFVSGAAASQPRFDMAHTIMEIADNFQMKVIAEGVETDHQRDVLNGMGCQEGQGFLFSQALDEAAFSDWLLSKTPARSVAGHITGGNR